MNNGKVRPNDQAIQNSFQFFPEESIPSPRRNSCNFVNGSLEAAIAGENTAAFQSDQKAAQNGTENLTKKQLKKLKHK